MSSDDHDDGRAFSRRVLLTRAALFSAGAIVPAEMLVRRVPGQAAAGGTAAGQAPAAAREPLDTLTAAEAATLEAIAARLIPTDGNGPGAADARAARYIDRALGGALADAREAYRAGLAAVDAYARASKSAPFAQLSAADQDAVLTEMESTPFFTVVRTHTIQGTFCDPYYGGNANFVGWDLIGYPGIRLAVTADQQRLGARPAPTHRSAYDHAMFSKKRPARASGEGGRRPASWRLT